MVIFSFIYYKLNRIQFYCFAITNVAINSGIKKTIATCHNPIKGMPLFKEEVYI